VSNRNPVSDHLAWFKRLGREIDRLARRTAALEQDALARQIIREMVARYESRQHLSFHFADSEEMPMGAAKVDQKERRARKINQVFQVSASKRAGSGT
jgi:hypothetical protein